MEKLLPRGQLLVITVHCAVTTEHTVPVSLSRSLDCQARHCISKLKRNLDYVWQYSSINWHLESRRFTQDNLGYVNTVSEKKERGSTMTDSQVTESVNPELRPLYSKFSGLYSDPNDEQLEHEQA